MISQEQLVSTVVTHTEVGVMVDVCNLIKSYHHKTVVNNVSFNVRRGEIFGVLGVLATWYICPKNSSFSENGCTK